MRLFLVVLALVTLVTAPLLIWGDEIDERLAGEKGVALLEQYGSWALPSPPWEPPTPTGRWSG